MTFYLFTDLDDSLFQTLRKCGDDTRAEASLMPGALGRDGNPLSFVTPRQQAFFSLADAHMRVVPVTARNYESFSRVCLPFRHGAILNYGGTILTPSGEEDTLWRERTIEQLRSYRPLLEAAFARLESITAEKGLTSYIRYIREPFSDLPLYVLAKNLDRRTEQLDVLHAELAASFHADMPWRLHHNDNNLAVLPGCLDKKHAVAQYMAQHIPAADIPYLSLGMGDSIEDIAFMSLCDYAVIPKASQIAETRLRIKERS